MIGLLVVVLIAFALGMAAGRWWVVPVPPLVWVLYLLGRHWQLWGSGTGDGWVAALVLVAALLTAGAIAGVAVRRSRLGAH